MKVNFFSDFHWKSDTEREIISFFFTVPPPVERVVGGKEEEGGGRREVYKDLTRMLR